MVTTKHKPIVNTQKRKTKSSKYKVIEQEKKKGTTKIARKKKKAVSTYLSIITWNKDELNSPMKRNGVANWIKNPPRTIPMYMVPTWDSL